VMHRVWQLVGLREQREWQIWALLGGGGKAVCPALDEGERRGALPR
jgi:hypothetical protein